MGMSIDIYRVLPSFYLVAGETVPSENASGDTSELDPVADPALSFCQRPPEVPCNLSNPLNEATR